MIAIGKEKYKDDLYAKRISSHGKRDMHGKAVHIFLEKLSV